MYVAEVIKCTERNVVKSSSNDIDDVASLLRSAFESDYKAMVDLDDDETLELLKDTWSVRETENETYLIAVENGKTIGIAHLQWGDKVRFWFDAPRKELYKKYGRKNTRRFLLGKRVFQMDVQDGDCYLAHLAVAEGHQGKGIGSMLLDASKEFASDHGFTRLTLIVSEKNPGARALYERNGFETTDVRYGLMEKIMFDDPRWRHMAASIEVTDSFPSS